MLEERVKERLGNDREKLAEKGSDASQQGICIYKCCVLTDS